jgi:hypothetical protein
MQTLHTLALIVLAVLMGAALLYTWMRPMRVNHAECGLLHLAAWFQSVDPANAFQAIPGVPDPAITVQGNDIRVPKPLPFVVGYGGVINDASLARAELQSPSLRATLNLDVEPVVQGKIFTNPQLFNIIIGNGVPIVPDESLNWFVQSDPAAAAIHYGLAMLADAPLQPVKGNYYSVRATAACALVAGTWVNGALTFAQVLPAGSYQVVGMRARGANLLAARLVFVGGTYRPGVIAAATIGGLDNDYQRFGNMGVFGQFDNTTPPTVDCLGDTDAAQSFIFDLIKVK